MIINLVFVSNSFELQNHNKLLNNHYEYLSFDKNEFKKELDSAFSANLKLFGSFNLDKSRLDWNFYQFEIEFSANKVDIISFKKMSDEDLKKLVVLL